MKYLITFLFLGSAFLFSQDLDYSKKSTVDIREIFLSAAKGEQDPFDVLAKVIEMGGSAVKPLEEFLFTVENEKPIKNNPINDSLSDSMVVTQEEIKPNKVYAVLALEGIGTPSALHVIMQAALTHPEVEVKAAAVKILGNNFFYKAQDEKLMPDKEILHVLMLNADDTSYVERYSQTLGATAREGIKNWTDEDYGDLPVVEDSLSARGFKYIEQKIKSRKDNREISMKEFREEVWQEDEEKYKWSKEKLKFKKE